MRGTRSRSSVCASSCILAVCRGVHRHTHTHTGHGHKDVDLVRSFDESHQTCAHSRRLSISKVRLYVRIADSDADALAYNDVHVCMGIWCRRASIRQDRLDERFPAVRRTCLLACRCAYVHACLYTCGPIPRILQTRARGAAASHQHKGTACFFLDRSRCCVRVRVHFRFVCSRSRRKRRKTAGARCTTHISYGILVMAY